MRIWGYLLVVAGITFMGLFALTQVGGGHLGYLPWFIAIVLTLTGWSFVKSATGLVRAKPAANIPLVAEQPAASSSDAAEAAPLTVEVPMTPEAAAAIARLARRRLRVPLFIAGGILVLFVLLGMGLAIGDSASGEGVGLFVIFAIIGVITALMIVGISWLATRPLLRDTRETYYYRTTGPVEVVLLSLGGAVLRLADRSFLLSFPAEIQALRTMSSGTVEYSAHGHAILTATDGQGTLVYTALTPK